MVFWKRAHLGFNLGDCEASFQIIVFSTFRELTEIIRVWSKVNGSTLHFSYPLLQRENCIPSAGCQIHVMSLNQQQPILVNLGLLLRFGMGGSFTYPSKRVQKSDFPLRQENTWAQKSVLHWSTYSYHIQEWSWVHRCLKECLVLFQLQNCDSVGIMK